MKIIHKIAIFEGNQIRRHWDEGKELWYFSVVDVVGVLSASDNPRNYWKVLKSRLKKEGSEVVTKCNQLKMRASDGGTVAGNARKEIESKTGRKVVSAHSFKTAKRNQLPKGK